MIIITTFKAFNSMQICLLKLKWINNKTLINLALNALKVFFTMSVNAKNDFHFSFFAFLINSCKNVTILK